MVFYVKVKDQNPFFHSKEKSTFIVCAKIFVFLNKKREKRDFNFGSTVVFYEQR